MGFSTRPLNLSPQIMGIAGRGGWVIYCLWHINYSTRLMERPLLAHGSTHTHTHVALSADSACKTPHSSNTQTQTNRHTQTHTDTHTHHRAKHKLIDPFCLNKHS